MNIPKFSHNIPIYGELGRYPLNLKLKCNLVKYWSRILMGDTRKLNYNVYKILFNLHNNGRYESPWLLAVKNTLLNCNMQNVWENQSGNIDPVQLASFLNNNYKQSWSQTVRNIDDLWTFNQLKFIHEREYYFDCKSLTDEMKKYFLKFRIGYYRIPVNNIFRKSTCRNMRLCRKCNDQTIGDEYHLFFECPFFNDIRLKMLTADIRSHPSMAKFVNLLRTHDEKIIKQICKFLKSCFVLL